MEITLEQYDKIQQYLDGRMGPAQAKDFLQELNSNKELNDSCEFEKSIRENIRSIRETREILAFNETQDELSRSGEESGNPADRAFMRNIIEKSANEWKEGRPPAVAAERTAGSKVVPLRRWAAIVVAASLLIATGSIVFLHFYGNHAEDPASLFAAFFKKDTIPQKNYPMLAQALADYKNNSYATLQNYDLENLPTLKGEDDQRQKTLELGYYYKGISYLATGEPAKAASDLQWVIDHARTEELVWKAQWYEALAFIRSSNMPAAIGLLRSVSLNPKAEGYNRQATVLLDKLIKANR